MTAAAASIAAALGNVTLSWVVCCSAPSWVVGLAMLGMSSSLALALEPLGYMINLFAYGGLLPALNLLADRGLQSERKITTIKGQISERPQTQTQILPRTTNHMATSRGSNAIDNINNWTSIGTWKNDTGI